MMAVYDVVGVTDLDHVNWRDTGDVVHHADGDGCPAVLAAAHHGAEVVVEAVAATGGADDEVYIDSAVFNRLRRVLAKVDTVYETQLGWLLEQPTQRSHYKSAHVHFCE